MAKKSQYKNRRRYSGDEHPSHRPADREFYKTMHNLAHALKRGKELNEEEKLGPKCDRCSEHSPSVQKYGDNMLCYDCSSTFMMRD